MHYKKNLFLGYILSSIFLVNFNYYSFAQYPYGYKADGGSYVSFTPSTPNQSGSLTKYHVCPATDASSQFDGATLGTDLSSLVFNLVETNTYSHIEEPNYHQFPVISN